MKRCKTAVCLTTASGPVQLVVVGLSLVGCSGGGGQDGVEPAVPGEGEAAGFPSHV